MAEGPAPRPAPPRRKKPSSGEPLFDGRTILFLCVGVAMFATLAAMIHGRAGAGGTAGLTGPTREYANSLVDAQLYDAAAVEYERLLEGGRLDDNQRANLSLVVADLYKDEAHDYAKALQYYLRVKHLYPKSKLADQVGPKIVECLERLGRSLDAKLELEAQTKLDSDKGASGAPEGKAVVARIGKREITYADLDKEIKKLPDYLREQFDQPGKKVEFLQQYLATELLYDKAKRLNLETDPEIVENAFQVKRSMMVQKLLDQEVRNAVKLTPEDLKLYYEAHKDRYTKKENGKVVGQKTLVEAKDELEGDLRREREQGAQQKLLQQLMQAENVQLYTDLFPADASKLHDRGVKAK